MFKFVYLLDAVPQTDLTRVSCSVINNGYFANHSGKLLILRTNKKEMLNTRISDGYELLTKLLALSNDFQKFNVKIKDDVLPPVVLEEGMFLSNKQLEVIELSTSIQEIRK